MNDLVRIRDLSKHYDGFDLDKVSLTIPAGCIVGFIGSNGAGKTTTIKSLLGLIIPDGGTIEVFGQAFDAGTSSVQITSIKQRIGVVFDSCSFPEELKVKNVGKLMSYVYATWNQEKFDNLVKRFELDDDKMVKDLSRGMGMKLTLACALAHNPDLLVLDEATAGLDPMAREEILDILREYQRDEQHGILISSHITSDLDKIADYIVCIDHGHIIFSMEKDAITEAAGIALCRHAQFDTVVESGFYETGTMHYNRREYGVDLLVEDRAEFMRRFPDIACDRIDIETFMSLMLKGALR